jgi:hypothetical protein
MIIVINKVRKKLPAFPAQAVYFHLVPLGREPVRLGKFVLEPFDTVVLHLDESAALKTDQMIVMIPADLRFVSRLGPSDLDLFGDAAFAHQLKVAVNGGEADLGITLFEKRMEIFRRDVFIGRKKGLDDDLALPRDAEPLGPDVVEKCVLSLR